MKKHLIIKYLIIGFLVLLVGVLLYNLFYKKQSIKLENNENYLFSIKDTETEIIVYGTKISLDVGINKIFIKSNKNIKEVYFYMPPMPGMGEMREDAQLKKTGENIYEATVNISMAGGWQVIFVLDDKKLTYSLNIPFYPGGEKQTQNGSIQLDKQKIGVEVAEVGYKDLTESFNVVGYVSYDLPKIKSITLRSDGWVIDTFERFEGEEIKKGTPLLKVLSPDLEIVKEELKLAKSLNREDLEKAVLEKLRYLGKGEVIVSPVNGVITKKGVYDGGFIKSGEVAYEIVDTSTLWIIAEIPYIYISSVKKNMEVLITPVGSEDSITGKIDYIFPEANKESKTFKCRIKVIKPKDLKINQLVDILIEKPLGKILAVPESAVVDTGDRQIVFLETSDGSYVLKKVKIGRCVQDYCQVLEGLKEGDKVVVKGNFLLDSEAQIKNLY
ncbi:efflux RND transporter periplasmic adaptor subunit [Sulfurihydrogenibium subterraneum]|uniref:efflux RND transporter periplasmic adaptor subunit n=1 Tax=Sulfurihydrogenibium subterraneum TaxID=171121 RepID=UPI00048F135D|nr:efflux RND transporter periplasmic adaptor subunit [Sulfurihydrogenibium subterraneum]